MTMLQILKLHPYVHLSGVTACGIFWKGTIIERLYVMVSHKDFGLGYPGHSLDLTTINLRTISTDKS